MGLRGILENLEAVSPGRFVDRVHVRRLAVKVDRQDYLGFLSYGRLDSGRVHVVSPLVRLHRDRGGAGVGDSQVAI